MRECVFLVADANMAAALAGFFSRDGVHRSLGTGQFAFDEQLDLVVATGNNDPGLYVRGHELIRTHQRTHRRVVVVVDQAWAGSPGAAEIDLKISGNLVASGWPEAAVAVIVIDPELEAWVWQDNPHVERALNHVGPPSLREALRVDGSWPDGQAKPTDPKGAVESVLRRSRRPRSSSIYRDLCSRVGVRGCKDGAFLRLRAHLREWFPAGDGA